MFQPLLWRVTLALHLPLQLTLSPVTGVFFTDDCTVTFTAHCRAKGTAMLAFHLKCNVGLQLLYIPPTSTGGGGGGSKCHGGGGGGGAALAAAAAAAD